VQVVLAAAALDASNIRAKIGRDVFCDDNDPAQDGAALVKTAHDRTIGLAAGLAVDMSDLRFKEIPDDAIYVVTIGERIDIPLLGEDPVDEVVVRTPALWVAQEDSPDIVRLKTVEDEQIPSGLPDLEWAVRDIVAGNDLPLRQAARQKMIRAFKGGDAKSTGLTLPSDWE
jgi:hypothetical protein